MPGASCSLCCVGLAYFFVAALKPCFSERREGKVAYINCTHCDTHARNGFRKTRDPLLKIRSSSVTSIKKISREKDMQSVRSRMSELEEEQASKRE